MAQRMRLSVEALGGARIEKVYTLLDLETYSRLKKAGKIKPGSIEKLTEEL